MKVYNIYKGNLNSTKEGGGKEDILKQSYIFYQKQVSSILKQGMIRSTYHMPYEIIQEKSKNFNRG